MKDEDLIEEMQRVLSGDKTGKWFVTEVETVDDGLEQAYIGVYGSKQKVGVMYPSHATLTCWLKNNARGILLLLQRQLEDSERLRGALRQILEISADRQSFVMMGPRAFVAAEQIAKAALEGSEGG